MNKHINKQFSRILLFLAVFVLSLSSISQLSPRETEAAVIPWGEGNVSMLGKSKGPRNCGIVNNEPACWGYNSSGALGDGTTSSSSTPVDVDMTGALSGRSVTFIDGGLSSTCAIASGQAFCWGGNNNGQLGNNSTDDSHVPVAVDTAGVLGGKTIGHIGNGESHACAVADGQAYCWGGNSNGQLGNNSTDSSLVPVAVDTSGALGGRTVTNIVAGSEHTCVLADNQAFCWGGNNNGQLGNNSTDDSHVPVAVDTSGVLNGKDVTSLSAGAFSTCAVADGQAFCWGGNNNGQLGNNSTDDSHVPVAVDTAGILGGKSVTDISVGSNFSCAVADGQAFCWGGNNNGQLGNNSTDSSLVPVAVDTSGALNGRTVSQISSSGSGTACVLSMGRVYCWGFNTVGQIGDGTTSSRLAPVLVTRITPEITSVSFSGDSTDRILTVHGDWSFTSLSSAYMPPTAPLIDMNGEVVPFCTNSVYSSAVFAGAGIDPAYFSDNPLCYLLIDESSNALMTSHQVQIRLPQGFDETAPITLRVVDAGPHTITPGTESEEPYLTAEVDGKSLSGTPEISKRPTFSGTTVPLSDVTVTVNSDPVTCTTTADASGNWSCTLPSDLPPGQHTVTVVVTTPDNEEVTVGPYTVNVLGEPTTIDGNLADTGSAIIIPAIAALFITGISIRQYRHANMYKL